MEPDPASVEEEWEGVLRRLEDAGFAVETVEPGTVLFETRGVERLYGGVQPALERALAAVGTAWDPARRSRQRRFAALAAASVARPGQIVIVEGERERDFLAPLPLSLLPLPERYAELEGLGVRRLGDLARLPGGAVAERLGPEGRRAWRLARGGERRRVRGRAPAVELAEALSFPEAVGNELTLLRARRAARSADRPAGAQDGRSARSPSPPSSSAAGPGGARQRSGRRRRSAHGFASRSGPSWRSCRRPCSSCGSRRFSWPSTRAASRRSCRPRARSLASACARACGR